MAADTSIQWTDRTWNPTTGCTKISPGCGRCYIERTPPFRTKGIKFVDGSIPVTLYEDRLDTPLRWRKPQRIFVNSMSDLFHEDVPDAFIERVFSVMALAERHTFQVLTKRPERMLAWFRARRFDVKDHAILQSETGECVYAHPWPLPNVWLGVSVENQHFADERIPLLLQTPAAVRFISAEPLLGPVDLERVENTQNLAEGQRYIHALKGYAWDVFSADYYDVCSIPGQLDWVIVGGESGAGARPFDVAWARSIVAQCQGAGVACFVKQLGRNVVVRNDGERDERWPGCTVPIRDDYEPSYQGEDAPIDLRDSHGGDPAEWPEDLRVRQFPR
jgi:protein gp37